MKFAKIAKDRAGKVLNEGDIVSCRFDEHVALGVVRKITQRAREMFPELHVTFAVADWRGANIKTYRRVLGIEEYKNCSLVPSTRLRDDTELNRKIIDLQGKV